jgi:hypothetical protein
MKIRMPDRYYTSGIILIIAAAIFIAIPLVSYIGDISTAALVFAGLACLMTGSFIVTLSGGESMDPRIVSLLQATGSINLCRISSDRGIYRNAYFLPQKCTGKERVMQLNPVDDYDGSEVSVSNSFLKSVPRGLITIPSCDLLVEELKTRNAMAIPSESEELTTLLNETIGDTFDFASRVSADWNGSLVTITLHDFLFYEECLVTEKKSPECCNKFPCPVCSLCGALIAEGLEEVVMMEHCGCDAESRNVTITFLIKSLSYRIA